MRAPLRSLAIVAGMLALGAPLASRAAPAAPTTVPSATAPAQTSANTLTLYSEPGLRGRRATYRTTAAEVERQGFVARSASSTGMWTLCEGGEVVSRCQTVDGQAPELRFAPQLVRPGLNALALYEQPGLKGRSIVYSFPADRPAPFHARSARTWGGAWSLCERGFQRCQMLDGKNTSIDFVVGAVRPEPGAAWIQSPAAAPAIPAKTEIRSAPKAPRPLPISVAAPPKPAPVKARSLHAKAPPMAKSLRPPRLVQIAEPRKITPPPHHLVIQLTEDPPRRHWREVRTRERGQPSPPVRAAHRSLLTPVHAPASARRPEAVSHHLRDIRVIRDERPVRHAVRSRLVHVVSDGPARHAHAPRRRLYRHVRMLWGGPDPYLYDADPRDFRPDPW